MTIDDVRLKVISNDKFQMSDIDGNQSKSGVGKAMAKRIKAQETRK